MSMRLYYSPDATYLFDTSNAGDKFGASDALEFYGTFYVGDLCGASVVRDLLSSSDAGTLFFQLIQETYLYIQCRIMIC